MSSMSLDKIGSYHLLCRRGHLDKFICSFCYKALIFLYMMCILYQTNMKRMEKYMTYIFLSLNSSHQDMIIHKHFKRN
jgi:hypothetical protein